MHIMSLTCMLADPKYPDDMSELDGYYRGMFGNIYVYVFACSHVNMFEENKSRRGVQSVMGRLQSREQKVHAERGRSGRTHCYDQRIIAIGRNKFVIIVFRRSGYYMMNHHPIQVK